VDKRRRDAGGEGAAGKGYAAAKATFTTLVDTTHTVSSAFQFINVPMGVWIDEQGRIVRPAEPAWAASRTDVYGGKPLTIEGELYVAALRDWVDRGADSPYALAPAEVVRRSRPRGTDDATANAHFELAQTLHTIGDAAGATAHFKAAQRLDPTNWTSRRDAWAIAGPEHASIYGTTWLDDVKREGVGRYYPALEM